MNYNQVSSEEQWPVTPATSSDRTTNCETNSPEQSATPVKRMRLASESPSCSDAPTIDENRSISGLPSVATGFVEPLTPHDPETEDLDEAFDEDEVERDEDDDEDEEEDGVSTMLGDDDAESVVTRLISPALEQERAARKVEDRKLLALLAHFDEEQLNRFEMFRRATFSKASVRRLIQSIASGAVSQNVVIAIAGMTKVFVGELVEEALDYKERLGELGPLQPKHIREAYRLLSETQDFCRDVTENPLR